MTPGTRLLLVTLLAAGLGSIRGSSAADATDKALLKWIVDHGGEVNVGMGIVNGYRGTVATQDLKKGDIMAVIPLNLTVDLPTDQAEDGDGYEVHNAAVQILTDMADPKSLYQPYWASLPEKGSSLMSTYFFPPDYTRMLQAPELENYIDGTQEMTRTYFNTNKETLQSKGFTLEDLNYALTIITTRYFGYENRSHLIPLLDMANHENGCPHEHLKEGCPNRKGSTCIVWRAGKPVAKGQEICNSYAGMYNDRSLLQYGYLNEAYVNLMGVDRHDFDQDNLWDNNMWDEEPEKYWSESPAEYREELARLRWLVRDLEFGDKPASEEKPVSSDPDATILNMMHQFRKLRKTGLLDEMERIKTLLRAMGEEVWAEEDYPDETGEAGEAIGDDVDMGGEYAEGEGEDEVDDEYADPDDMGLEAKTKSKRDPNTAHTEL